MNEKNCKVLAAQIRLETLKVINLIYKSAKEGIHVKNDHLEA